VVGSALERAQKRAKGKATDEVAALRRADETLDAETWLRDADLAPEERRELRALAPLTLKPTVVVANLEEGTEVPVDLPGGTVGVYASIEAETAEMDLDEARALLEEFGVREPGLETVIRACYQALDLITFLTTGEDETRAWEVRNGAKAPEAAGVIHTDLERGFIRAEGSATRSSSRSADGRRQAPRQAPGRGQGLRRPRGRRPHVRFAV
jgi:ribosome-binding ATPase YchF (GTP1/OBG family)